MSARRKFLMLLLSIASAPGADNKAPKFSPGPASSYPNHQKLAQVTLAALACETDEQARPPFGKLNPYRHGVLPVLLLISNESSQALRLDQLRVEYISLEGHRIEATPAADVQYLDGPGRPKMTKTPSPIPGLGRKKKNPLAAWEIEGRAFAARMLPAGESAHGFFYFRGKHRSGSVLYVTGLQEAATGKDLFYFEIPLDKPAVR